MNNTNKFIEEKVKGIRSNFYVADIARLDYDGEWIKELERQIKQALSDAIKYGEENGVEKVKKLKPNRIGMIDYLDKKVVLANLTK